MKDFILFKDFVHLYVRPTREQVIWCGIVWAVAIGLWAVAGEDRPWKSRRK